VDQGDGLQKRRTAPAGNAANPEKTSTQTPSVASSAGADCPSGWPESLRDDAQLCELIAAWPTLTARQRDDVLAIVRQSNT